MSCNKKKSIPPYLAIMMLNPCEMVSSDGSSSSDRSETDSISTEQAPLMPKGSTKRIYDKQAVTFSKRVHAKSWGILIMYFIVTLSVNSSWFLFASINSTIRNYYEISAILTSLLTLCFPFMFVLTGSLVHRMLYSYSPSALLLLGAFFNALGAAVRCRGTERHGFAILLLGQCFCGLAGVPVLCLTYSIHTLCFHCTGKVAMNIFIIFTNILGIAIGFLCSPLAVRNTTSLDITGWEIYRYLLCLAVISVIVLVIVPFTLKGLSVSLSLDEYNHKARNKAIKKDEFEKQMLSIRLVISRTNYKEVLQNIPLQMLANAYGLCFADATIYLLCLEKVLHDELGVAMTAWSGYTGFASLILGFLTGIGLRRIVGKYSCAKYMLLYLICQSAVFDLLFVILHRFHLHQIALLTLYCISQVSSVSALIIYADQITKIKTAPSGVTIFITLAIACVYALIAGLLATILLSTFGETSMLAVTEIVSLSAVSLTVFLKPNLSYQRSKKKDEATIDEEFGGIRRRDSVEGIFV